MYNFQNIFSDCKIVEINKYLKMQCTVNDQTQYKCWGSDEFYIGQVDKLCQAVDFSRFCSNDPHSYQLCGFEV